MNPIIESKVVREHSDTSQKFLVYLTTPPTIERVANTLGLAKEASLSFAWVKEEEGQARFLAKNAGGAVRQTHVYDAPKSQVLQQQRVLSRYSSPCHSRLRRIYAQAGSLPNSLDRKWTSPSLYSLQYSPKVTKVC